MWMSSLGVWLWGEKFLWGGQNMFWVLFPLGLSRISKGKWLKVTKQKKKIQYQDNQNTTGLQFLETRGRTVLTLRSVAELCIGEMAGSYSFFSTLNQIFNVTPYLYLKYFGVVLTGKRVGEQNDFSKIFHRCYSTIDKLWVREGLYGYAVGNNAFRDWSCFFPWKSIPSWSWNVQHSAALVHIQSTQENFRRSWLGQMLKLSFQIMWLLKYLLLKGRGIFWQLVFGSGLWLGLGGGWV